ncbi:MAG TPA: hypothetical protein VN699_02830, partial [Pirellulales bacterium]|nr:hypothetical protein [Pirellulales bacterium]
AAEAPGAREVNSTAALACQASASATGGRCDDLYFRRFIYIAALARTALAGAVRYFPRKAAVCAARK